MELNAGLGWLQASSQRLKKNRHLYLAVASGCTLVELFLIRPFLVGCMICHILLHFPAFTYCWMLSAILLNVLDHSVKVKFRQDKDFLTFCFFVSFSVQACLHAYILLH